MGFASTRGRSLEYPPANLNARLAHSIRRRPVSRLHVCKKTYKFLSVVMGVGGAGSIMSAHRLDYFSEEFVLSNL